VKPEHHRLQRLLAVLAFVSLPALAAPDWSLTLTDEEMARAEENYQTYCALCHGEDRTGYRADHAPSLRTQSLLSTAYPRFLYTAMGYGRANTAMEGYSEEMGGPLSRADLRLITRWLAQVEGIEPVTLPGGVVHGDAELGAELYASTCAECHGAKGEGITAPAIGDQALLANASDHFLRHAIAKGREGTPMVAFEAELEDAEIDALVAYLRSQASGWSPKPPKLRTPADAGSVRDESRRGRAGVQSPRRPLRAGGPGGQGAGGRQALHPPRHAPGFGLAAQPYPRRRAHALLPGQGAGR
jgi:cytochrome c oxidase cbb3-type subunit 3